jgi:hypothetical protein
MDNALLMLLGIVAVVGIVGVLTVVELPSYEPLGAPTGRVIEEFAAPAEDCSACSGEPVCAGAGNKASNYPSACDARCSGAHILYEGYCEQIPQAASKR